MVYYVLVFLCFFIFLFTKLGSSYVITGYLHLMLLLKTAKWFWCCWKWFLESLSKLLLKSAYKKHLFHLFIFWTQLAFGPVQYYPTSAPTFVRVGAGCHFTLLNIKPTLKGHRFVTFEKHQKSKKSKGLKEFQECFLGGRSSWSPNTVLKLQHSLPIWVIIRIANTSVYARHHARGLLHILAHLVITNNTWNRYCNYPIWRQGNGGAERLSSLSDITQLESGGVRIQIQAAGFWNLCPNHCLQCPLHLCLML